jgi:hypothetical protein
MRAKIFILLLCCISHVANAQTHYGDQWMIGSSFQKLDFKVQPPKIDTLAQVVYKYFMLGHSNICDSDGNLILVSDGYNIYDSLGNYIDDGDTLVSYSLFSAHGGWSPIPQTSLILPIEDKIYYLITPNANDSVYANWYGAPYISTAWFDELLVHKIDMNANGGMGKVVERGKKIMQNEKLLLSMMMACRHANGKDWWLLKQMYEDSGNFDGLYPLCKNKIAKILITKDSIYPPSYQYFTETDIGFFYNNGQAMFNQQGTKYAVTCRSMNKVFLADFDRCTGMLSNGKALNVPNFSRHDPSDTTLQDIYTQGLCFSPNGKFLYVNKFFNLLQCDLTDPDSSTAWYHIAGLDTTWAAFQKYSSMANIGPDGKLYVGNWWGVSKQMSVINNPNVKGAGCDFCPRCLRSQANYGVSSPPCMPNYDLGANLPCWPLGNEEIIMEQDELVVYPNPSNGSINIQYNFTTEASIVFYDITGREVYKAHLTKGPTIEKIQLPSLVSGMYTYVVRRENNVTLAGKIEIQ